ncbi:hypothetical protein TFUB22_00690 [Tannerella forsythia]|nr:hypothetical protein TFUB22_00690 [Tannerella forsythia]
MSEIDAEFSLNHRHSSVSDIKQSFFIWKESPVGILRFYQL